MFDERLRSGNGHAALPPDDRRTHPRFHFCAAAEALDPQHRTRMNARTSDLGRGGCYVDTFSPYPLKTAVKIRLTREKTSFTAEAKVVYSKIGMGMGLSFTSIEPREMNILDKWIGELSGSIPAEIAELPATREYQHVGAGNSSGATESGYVLNELIIALMRRGALTEEEGKTMLLRLLHRDFLP
jgi:hypothetical protein